MELVLLMLMVAVCVDTGAFGADVLDPKKCTSFPCLIFDENFDFLDHNVWTHEITMGGGGNGEFQTYVNNRSVSYTKDGALFIKPDMLSNWKGEEFLSSGDLDLWGMNGINDVCTSNLYDGCRRQGTPAEINNPVQSARLRTTENFHFTYGRLEVRAKMPRASWMWPAIWLLPRRHPYGGWPASGEMDLVETRGNDDYGVNNALSNLWGSSTVHWGPYAAVNRYEQTTANYQSPQGVSFADEFHVWALEWTPEYIEVTVDGEIHLLVDPITNFWDYGNFVDLNADNPWQGRGKMAPFDQDFYLLLNVAVGGTNGYFPDVPTTPPKPWLNTSPVAKLDFWNGRADWYPTWTQGGDGRTSENAAMQVDYIRVYKMTAEQV